LPFAGREVLAPDPDGRQSRPSFRQRSQALILCIIEHYGNRTLQIAKHLSLVAALLRWIRQLVRRFRHVLAASQITLHQLDFTVEASKALLFCRGQTLISLLGHNPLKELPVVLSPGLHFLPITIVILIRLRRRR
jgi:hypothetical protein